MSSAEAKTRIGAWHKRLYNTIIANGRHTAALGYRLPKVQFVVFFVTFNTHHRKKLLANALVHNRFVEFAKRGQQQGITVGRYVIMPDHAHLFVSGGKDLLLTQWIRLLKHNLSKAISHPQPHWQKGFFDHLIRRGESYAEKWEYVRQNPVGAGLASNCDDWLWQGEIIRIDQQEADY